MSTKRKILIIATFINFVILILIAICFLRISEMHREINAVGDDFLYTEMDCGTILLDLGSDGVASMNFSQDGVSITDSYRFDNKDSLPVVLRFVRYYAAREGYDISQSNLGLIGEYRLHTILYKIGYKPNQTKTLNWDFNGDARWYVNTASLIIGWCGV